MVIERSFGVLVKSVFTIIIVPSELYFILISNLHLYNGFPSFRVILCLHKSLSMTSFSVNPFLIIFFSPHLSNISCVPHLILHYISQIRTLVFSFWHSFYPCMYIIGVFLLFNYFRLFFSGYLCQSSSKNQFRILLTNLFIFYYWSKFEHHIKKYLK